MLARQLHQPAREIIYRTRGHTHGPITRLVSPGDLGELIKPFVFLDLFGMDTRNTAMKGGFGWHPHSGIATVTVMLEGATRYAETTGKEGILTAGGVEFMRAGNGVWHTGSPQPGRTRGFQLWVALPPELENAPNASHYVEPKDVPSDGRVRVILGEYGNQKSPIAAPPMTYLAVSLRAGERWTFEPSKGHTVAWVAVSEGVLRTSGSAIPAGEVAIFAPSEEPIEFTAEGDTGFVLGSATKHPHELVMGNYSVHTSEAALQRGESEIRRIGLELRDNGTLGR
jgi:redox-sensitive bicupin YhaK (pirin superfamily)